MSLVILTHFRHLEQSLQMRYVLDSCSQAAQSFKRGRRREDVVLSKGFGDLSPEKRQIDQKQNQGRACKRPAKR
jgi:hypothetical protein